MLTSSCGGGAASGGGTRPAAPSIYVTGVLLAPLPSSILEFPATANGEVSPTSNAKGPSDFFFDGLAVDAVGNAVIGHLSRSESIRHS
jgi:hypothetical protein